MIPVARQPRHLHHRRTSWAARLTQPTEYGIADALGQTPPARSSPDPPSPRSTSAATVGVCDPSCPVARPPHRHPAAAPPTVDDFDLTTEIPTVHQWIIDNLTGHNQQTEAAISHTLTTAPTHRCRPARSRSPRRQPRRHTRHPTRGSATHPGTTDGAAQAMATLDANTPSCAASADSPQHPKNPARTATEPRRHALRERGPVLHRSELEGTPRTPGGHESRRRLASRVVAD